MFLSKKLNKGAGTPVALDPQFNYVTMLLHGDGTNGAQNNTFLDSSTNNFTITRNGNTTQGSFSPYGSNWANYFDGSGDYLTAANNTALDVGTGAFTIEGWIYRNGTGDTDWRIVAGNTSSAGFFGGRGTLSLGFGRAAVAWDLESASNVYSLNTWTHVVYVRNGSGNLAIFANGTRVATTTNSNNYGLNGGLIEVGAEGANQYFGGYISNVRVVKGSAVYDPTASTLTVPTAPLTAVSGTGLLTCQSNRFKDNSTNNFTLTVNGTPSVQRFNPFGTSTAYSTSVIGGSGYFDGSGDTLTTSTSQIIPTGSFTVECWAYVTGANSTQKFVSQGTTGSAGRFSLGIEGGNWWVQLGNDAIQTGTPVKNQWNYVAVTYNGSTITLYVNGTSIGTVSSTANAQNTTLTIGEDWNSSITTGYISNVRISNTVRTISVPTTPYSSDGSTRLLLSMTNAAIFDNAMMNDLETVGNAQISTSVVKYGTGSLKFDGVDDYLLSPPVNANALGSGDFTVECWAYVITFGSYRTLVCFGDYGYSTGAIMYVDSVGRLRFFSAGFSEAITPTSVSLNTWNHFAVTRSAGTVSVFLNGVLGASVSITNNISSTQTRIARGIYTGIIDSESMYGYMDDVRITKGYARYTATFTPPTAAFPNIGPV